MYGLTHEYEEDCCRAGQHFANGAQSHGVPGWINSHDGDLRNLHSWVHSATYWTANSKPNLWGGHPSYIGGKAMTVYEDRDDYA